MYRTLSLLTVFLVTLAPLTAQVVDTAFSGDIARHRDHYRHEFVTEPRSPLTARDTAFLDFFPADRNWRIDGAFIATPGEPEFDMPTYSGRSARYRQYGLFRFQYGAQQLELRIYQNIKLLQMEQYKDYLFLPFKDPTNGDGTYGGGRYIELSLNDIKGDPGSQSLRVDFNKCFNPYCAYSDGYNCPVPPRENHLNIPVVAGEKLFRGEKKH